MSTNIEQLEALFNRAIEFRPDERPAFLAGACGYDTDLVARVQALLQAHDADAGILPERPGSEKAAGAASEKPGDRIGHYKLLEQIGEGGCGVVYMAEQEAPVRRLVALKVIKLGMDTKSVVARFEAERQALALMDHPNIAKVFDAGATTTGRPYFVMELVRGVKITEYSEQNNLSTSQRLDLVMQCCRAIQHAHQKGIIHRDIKPSNVLVSVHDGTAVPKVIDFGIAKAIEGRLTDQTLFTSFEQFVGTPAYMSPEQAQLRGLDVDTRTDIYSLGVLLYELLTGKTPFDAKELLLAGLDEMRKTIREKEPPRPSTRLAIEITTSEGRNQENRGAIPVSKSAPGESGLGKGSHDWLSRKREIMAVLRGDLDWIVMKCLEKDRTRRYETANGLAMDLQRHLTGEPVAARPPSSVYRFQKLVRRNKLAFSATAAVALALVLGIIGSTSEAIRARRAEREQGRLLDEADRARAGETTQRAAAEQHLYDALLGEARAKELSGRAGQRFESLEAINKAATIHRSGELSDAAVAAFSLPDFREQKRWQFASHWIAENLCFDQAFELYARLTRSGITVLRVQGNQEVVRLRVTDTSDITLGPVLRGFDPLSHYLAAACVVRNQEWRCRVWDLSRGGAEVLDLPSADYSDFSPDGSSIVIMDHDGTVAIKQLPSGRDLKRWRVDGQLGIVRFSPDGRKLGGIELGGSSLRVWEVASGRLITTILTPAGLSFFAWSADGTLVATGCENGEIVLWDVASGREKARMEGHESHISGLAFSHRGDLLASGSWDRTQRLWDLATGKQLVLYRTQDTELHFSPDDRTLAYALEGEAAKLLEVAHTTGYRRLGGHVGPSKSWSLDFSPDGHLAVVGTDAGLEFWDVIAGKKLGLATTTECRSACFLTNGELSVVGATLDGLYRWPVLFEPGAGGQTLRLGPPQTLVRGAFRYLAFDSAGREVLVSTEDRSAPFMLNSIDSTNVLRLRGHEGAEFVALDPSGRVAVTGTWKGIGVKVYRASTGQLIRNLPVEHSALVAFSPDGKWLATSDMNALKLWNTGTWEPLAQFLRSDGVSEVNSFDFSPDGRLLAVVRSGNAVQIVKVPGLEPVATLHVPTLGAITSIRFTRDGTTLAAVEWLGQLDFWDLRVVREELRKLNLDWDLPDLPPATESASSLPIPTQLDAGPFSKQELKETIPARDSNTSSNLIDLTEYYDAPLTQSWHSPREAHNDLTELQAGVHRLNGVEFDVRGLIQIGAFAANGLAYPSHVHGIPVGQPCRKLHFLHSAIFGGGAHAGDELGSYFIHYNDGRQIELPIITGKDMIDWWSRPEELGSNLIPAWTGNNPAARRAGRNIRLFQTTWENPFPDVPINQIDFTSDKPTPGQPFLLAITTEP